MNVILTKSELDEVLKKQFEVSVLHFSANWAPQCTQVDEFLNRLRQDKRYEEVKFFTVEAEKLPEVCQEYKIVAVPTIIVIPRGLPFISIDGVNLEKISSAVDDALISAQPEQLQLSAAEKLDRRIGVMINYAPVVIFMKGKPKEPRCKFSRELMQILKEEGIQFGSFDIFEDEAVRQRLKEYSEWPTYPQIYVNGTLLGGLDIIKELRAQGELRNQFPEECLMPDLGKLTKQSPVMLFMKGSPNEPKCGFSRQIIEIMKETGVPYGHFDILSDPQVRAGLKEYSNWPTYPQLYVKGEFIGGLDIVKELRDNGELLDAIKVD